MGCEINQKMAKRKIVEVEWLDAQSTMESYTLEELKDFVPLKTFSAGYLLLDTKKHIILGFMDFGYGNIKHLQCIPRGMIKKIKVIRDGD